MGYLVLGRQAGDKILLKADPQRQWPGIRQQQARALGPEARHPPGAHPSPVIRSRTSTSNATTVRCVTTGWGIICSSRLARCRSTPRDGSGHTITSGQTWPSEASPPNRSWPSWPDLYFWRALKMGGLPLLQSFLKNPSNIAISATLAILFAMPLL